MSASWESRRCRKQTPMFELFNQGGATIGAMRAASGAGTLASARAPVGGPAGEVGEVSSPAQTGGHFEPHYAQHYVPCNYS